MHQPTPLRQPRSLTGTPRSGRTPRAALARLVAAALVAGGALSPIPAMAAPAQPTTVSATPAHGSVQFSWNPVPGASAYKLEVSRSGDFSGTPADTAAIVDTYATSWIAPTTLGLARAGELWYRVSAFGSGTTESTRGEPSSPQVLDWPALAAPTPLSPNDGATVDYPAAITFSWSPIAGAVSYEIEYIAGEFASSSATSVVATTTATTFVPQKPLTPGLSYEWRVRATFYSGAGASPVPGLASAARTFTVAWPPAASQPVLVSPANSGSDPILSDPQLRWQPVAGAKSYKVLLGRSKDAAGNIVDPTVATVTGTAYIPRMSFSNTNYFWQVVAQDANGGAGAPSQVWQFKKALSYSTEATTTGAPAEVYPKPLTGSDEATRPTAIPLEDLELRWEPLPRATLYEVQVVPHNGSPRLTCQTASTSATVVGAFMSTGTEQGRLTGAGTCLWSNKPDERIQPGVTYTWRVRAVDYLGSATTGLQTAVASTAITSEWSDEEVTGQESRARWFTVTEGEAPATPQVELDLDAFEAQKDESLQGQPAPLLTWQPFAFDDADPRPRGYEVTVYAKGVGSSTQVAVIRTPQARLRINGVFDDNEVAEPYSASVRAFVLKSATTSWTTTTDLTYVSNYSADRFVWTKTSKSIDVSPGPQRLPDGTVVLTWQPQFTTAPLDGGSRGYAITLRDSAENVVGTAGYKVDLPFVVAQSFSSQSDSVGKPLPQGSYTYEVAPLDANGKATRYSTRAPFTIEFPPPTVDAKQPAGGTSQTVNWSPSTAGFKYQLRYKPASTAGSSWVTVGTASTSLGQGDPVQTAYVFSDLAPGDYVWQLRSVDTAGNVSAWTPEQSFTIGAYQLDPLTPDAAVLPVADRVLRWSPVAMASRYVVEISTYANFASATRYETIATALAVPTSVTAGTAYYWRVKAVPEVSTTSSTRPVLATSPTRSFSVRTVPAAVTGLKATISDGTSLSLTWTALTGPGAGSAEAPSYVIEVREKALGDDWSTARTVSTLGAATSSLVTGLASATAYEARVAARNSEGQGPWSAVVSATTASVPTAAPSSLQVTKGVGSLTVSWRAPSSSGTGGAPITGYVLRYRGTGAWTSLNLASTVNSRVLTGLAAGVGYTVEVSAVNVIGTGPAATASSTTLGPPGTVGSFKVTRGDKSAKLTWVTPASNGGSPVTGYVVQRRSYSSSTKKWSAWTSVTLTAATHTATGLTNGSTYEFRVAATTKIGTGAYTPAASVIPAGKPGASKLTVVAKTGKFALSWTAASSNGSAVTSYVVQYSADGKKWTTLKTTTASVRKLTTTVGKKGKTYYFRVVAKNSVGTGSYSKVIKLKRK